MPYKKGGGNKLQFYDDADGQYDDETRAKLNEDDKKALVLVHYFGISYNESPFHFPTYGIHDEEYCDIFVKYSRNLVKNLSIDKNKALYLLSRNTANDKSAFLVSIGYSLNNQDELISDICYHTDLHSLIFARHKKGYLGCVAKTVLNGRVVTTVWSLERDLSLRFITLIPGGDKRWK